MDRRKAIFEGLTSASNDLRIARDCVPELTGGKVLTNSHLQLVRQAARHLVESYLRMVLECRITERDRHAAQVALKAIAENGEDPISYASMLAFEFPPSYYRLHEETGVQLTAWREWSASEDTGPIENHDVKAE